LYGVEILYFPKFKKSFPRGFSRRLLLPIRWPRGQILGLFIFPRSSDMSLRVAVKKSDVAHDDTVHFLLCLGGAENFTALVKKQANWATKGRIRSKRAERHLQ
jgi:hypothetical protein